MQRVLHRVPLGLLLLAARRATRVLVQRRVCVLSSGVVVFSLIATLTGLAAPHVCCARGQRGERYRQQGPRKPFFGGCIQALVFFVSSSSSRPIQSHGALGGICDIISAEGRDPQEFRWRTLRSCRKRNKKKRKKGECKQGRFNDICNRKMKRLQKNEKKEGERVAKGGACARKEHPKLERAVRSAAREGAGLRGSGGGGELNTVNRHVEYTPVFAREDRPPHASHTENPRQRQPRLLTDAPPVHGTIHTAAYLRTLASARAAPPPQIAPSSGVILSGAPSAYHVKPAPLRLAKKGRGERQRRESVAKRERGESVVSRDGNKVSEQ